MIFRLGYVAMTLSLEDCSPSGTVTVSALNRLPDEETKLYRLRRVAGKNLMNTLRILRYNKALDIGVYRLTSRLIPLATHPAAGDWDYAAEFGRQLEEIGGFIRENDMRVSAHPDHFTLLNSKSGKVIEDSIRDLDYHVRLYEAMGLEDFRYKLVLHVGGLYDSKEDSLERFRDGFARLPDRIRNRIILENDDRSYSASDVLGLCLQLKIPMVLDVHHHNCLAAGERLEKLLPGAFGTWDGEYFVPKIHFSSPKSRKEFRSHADFIDPGEFLGFLETARGVGRDFDVMLEAKNKDQALLKLSEQLSRVKGLRRINAGKFELD
jgi:UV DNA damage endonuclease